MIKVFFYLPATMYKCDQCGAKVAATVAGGSTGILIVIHAPGMHKRELLSRKFAQLTCFDMHANDYRTAVERPTSLL